MDVQLKRIAWESDAGRAALALRIAVFCEEQGVPLEIEQDAWDVAAMHWGVFDDRAELVGTARVLVKEEVAKIGRVAVAKAWRGQGVGRAVMEAIHDELRGMDAALRIQLAAQLAVLPFYEKLGYKAEGGVFTEAGIEHRMMVWRG